MPKNHQRMYKMWHKNWFTHQRVYFCNRMTMFLIEKPFPWLIYFWQQWQQSPTKSSLSDGKVAEKHDKGLPGVPKWSKDVLKIVDVKCQQSMEFIWWTGSGGGMLVCIVQILPNKTNQLYMLNITLEGVCNLIWVPNFLPKTWPKVCWCLNLYLSKMTRYQTKIIILFYPRVTN